MRRPLWRHRRIVAYGMSHAFASSVGQTFFISLFVPHFMAAFAVERTAFSTLYSGCTILSALVLPYIGGLLDKFPLRIYALVTTLALAASCIWISFSYALVPFAVGLFLVRCLGQGVMTDINLTSTGRFFERSRGRAIGLTTLGHPLGEGLLPLVAVSLIASIGWRGTWQVMAVMTAAVTILGIVLLGRRDTHPERFIAEDDRAPPHTEKIQDEASPGLAHTRRQWTRAEVLRAPGFYLMMPFWVLPAVLLTGFFFHQLALADEKGWSHEFIASSFVYFAIFRGVTSFLAGPIVDRLSARKLLVWTMIPLLLGIGILALSDSAYIAPVYFGLAGTMGVASTTKGAFLPELFGTRHLGAIRALTVTAAVFGTAVCPPLFSQLLDSGFTFRHIAVGSVVFGLLTMVLCAVGIRALEREG